MPDQRTLVRPAAQEAGWLRDARRARLLSVATLGWLGVESALGLWTGYQAHSVALLSWGLAALVEALASLIVIWRFTGARLYSARAERTATRAVAVSFWLLAPYLVAHVAHDLSQGYRAAPSALGIAVTTISLVSMPLLGVAKRRVGARLRSAATAGEGTQNLLCAVTAAGVLLGLALNTIGWWWVDPAVALMLAAVAGHEGVKAWRGQSCCH
ncbi:membrane protein [Acrocarpospora corrugata]|uniref:Membrane protein n=1 Tax=Acrocarpospora corrugata TaxID=35763 RepID=A0A5M3VVL6_9ACTN|nr:cation transporter [Acrocarpospora corrugata]GER99721.1 membrane protein [Acrocarpospora corrugata]